MTKETQTQAIAEPFKFKNAALLNRLSEMAQVPYYATACHTLIQAEMAIVELERENATLRAEVERLAAQSAPTEAEYNPLLIDGVQHDPLCLKVYRSPLKECDCGASSRAAQPSQAPVVLAVQPEYCTACDMTSNDKQRCEDCPRRASSGATTQAVRMLTPREIELLREIRLHAQFGLNEGWQREARNLLLELLLLELEQYYRTIPPSGEIGGA